VAAIGVVLLLLGAWIVVKVGPSGEATFQATSKAPGAIVVPADVLNRVDVPVRIAATRRDGGPVRLTAAPTVDARAVLGTTAVSTVTAVHYPSGTMDLQASGSGTVPNISESDVWRIAAKGAGSAELVVDQPANPGSAPAVPAVPAGSSARGPETAVVTSGDATALSDVTVSLTWADRAWFFEALAVAIVGALLASFALIFLWQSREVAASRNGAARTVSEPTR